MASNRFDGTAAQSSEREWTNKRAPIEVGRTGGFQLIYHSRFNIHNENYDTPMAAGFSFIHSVVNYKLLFVAEDLQSFHFRHSCMLF